jgi:hypothetical protein
LEHQYKRQYPCPIPNRSRHHNYLCSNRYPQRIVRVILDFWNHQNSNKFVRNINFSWHLNKPMEFAQVSAHTTESSHTPTHIEARRDKSPDRLSLPSMGDSVVENTNYDSCQVESYKSDNTSATPLLPSRRKVAPARILN